MGVLVTGGAGYVGARLGVALAATHGDGEVDALDNLRRRGIELTPCPLCGGSRTEMLYAGCWDRLLGTPGRFDVVRCTDCGLARTNPRPTREAIGVHYPDSYAFFGGDGLEHGKAYGTFRDVARWPYRTRFGSESPVVAPRGGNRLLDIGSATGQYLAEMVEAGWEPWGIEPNRDAARRTIERLGIPEERVFVGSAEDADFPDASFDLVTMSHVLEHLHDPLDVLRKVQRWLRPGGVVRIWLPNFGSAERRVFGRLWLGLDVPRHLTHFTPKTLGLMLERTGFEVERSVPQWQGNMLTGSVAYLVDALLRRRRPYREPRALHYALLPVASVALALGEGGCLDVTSRKPRDDGGSPR
jgi:SAM-dependent methyltransferase